MFKILQGVWGDDDRPLQQDLTVQDAHDLAAKRAVTLIDVRTPDEWRNDGVAQRAETVTLQDPNLADKVHDLVEQNTEAPLAVICRSGARSRRACSILRVAGFTNVQNVKGGMMAWKSSNLPVKKDA